ncbi:hypothetical protein AN639_05110 [Candidatus Epulonipiscium fishelsonii]|uniref:Uncharacterized protein n=1 Tax=Candidatus Epulonipiscium fishelsonii TaxID=77094 RepID=A0ACC8XBU6_9FIRM|nr:hypothetical protein AN396_06845 [Epulopiscium sp. SCG-B11WGA-EpuloA1]ONI40265.1 hypothetical protein AN639_05110 [Epulopiscium sp. SCG-B05WGA-EpuloA1]
MTTLKDIAKACGLSITQVSRALNNHKDVSEETKIKVSEIAIQMGYVKNMSAQRLAMQISNQIALVVKGIEDENELMEYNSVYPILCGSTKYATQHNYEIAMYIIQDDIKSYVKYFQQKGIGKAILFGFEYNDIRFLELLESHYTCVCIDIPIEKENKGCVITDNTLYASYAVEALIKSGKKNVAMINGKSQAIVSIEREAGYLVALRNHNLEHRQKYIFDGNFDRVKAESLTFQIMKDYPDINGFFCASDYMAMGCMNALQALGKKIPQDVGVIGFDNIPMSRFIKPSLSTVSQNDFNKGYEAAKLLIGICENSTNTNVTRLSCSLEIRQSI